MPLGVHSDIYMFLVDDIAFNTKVGKIALYDNGWYIHEISFLYYIAPNIFFLFLSIPMQLIFVKEVGKCPKHSGGESLSLLSNCREPMASRHIKITKNYSETCSCYRSVEIYGEFWGIYWRGSLI